MMEITKTTKTMKTTQTATNKELSARLTAITATTEMTKTTAHGNPGCKPQVPQTTGLEIPDFAGRKAFLRGGGWG